MVAGALLDEARARQTSGERWFVVLPATRGSCKALRLPGSIGSRAELTYA